MVRFFLFVIVSALLLQANSLQKVSVQLDWKYQFEFAGFIAAQEHGYYRDAGLDVELREYEEGTDIVSDVLTQKATYGVYNSSIVVENGRVKPIVLLATYFQHSPLVFVAQKGIETPADMVGKTIMGTTDELKYSSLALLLAHFNITPKNSHFIPHTFNIDAFIEKKVDVMSAFSSNQLYDLDRLGIPYTIIDPGQYGFVMSAVNLFTSQKEALYHTERTQKFIDATNRGWAYALDHEDEIIDLLIHKYHVGKTRSKLKYEAKITRKLMMRDFFPIGQVNEELSIRSFKQLMQAGALVEEQKLGRFMFKEVIGNANGGVALSTAEKEYLLRKKKISMCIDPEWYPFERIEDGKHIGIAADVMKNFEQKLGITIELVPTRSWDESLHYAQERKCDILSLASATPQRQKYMDFTSAYITLPIVMATSMDKPFTEDITTLIGKKIGSVKGYAITEKLKEQFPQMDIVEVDSIKDGLKQVENGSLYGYIDNLVVVSTYIQKEYTGTLKVSSRLEDKVLLGVGTRNDEPILHGIFEKLVAGLDEPTMQEIYNRWTATVEQVPWIDQSKLWKAFALLSIVGLVFFMRYYELKRYNAKLIKLSIIDKLTGLYNRQKTDEKLMEEQRKVDRYREYKCGVMILDIDYFKTVNDTLGHQEGDRILQLLAEVFKNTLRQTDTIGRWGGEEFIVILPNTSLEQSYSAAENLRQSVETFPFGIDRPVTVSIGVGELIRMRTVHENIARIDEALYEAKNSGRNKVCKEPIPSL
ncbi:MAG: diguanylate cyclase [Sulfuricurvum sp.]|nr:diguanylate cyclase [Sulfuricurvum sp.]